MYFRGLKKYMQSAVSSKIDVGKSSCSLQFVVLNSCKYSTFHHLRMCYSTFEVLEKFKQHFQLWRSKLDGLTAWQGILFVQLAKGQQKDKRFSQDFRNL